ncbi:MAG: class I SAM-dependent methyltransferase [Pirellulales bacterium]
MTEPDRTLARRLARESLERGDATGWFDALYSAAQGDPSVVPWADQTANPNLLDWLAQRPHEDGRRALVVGCGLGDDAEALSERGYRVTAFDVSPTAIGWCRRRFPQSNVNYEVADALSLPAAWRRSFDLIVEIYTLQTLPPELRATAISQLASCLAPGGTLLVVARARDVADEQGTMPWPLTRAELDQFVTHGLQSASFADFLDSHEAPPVRRFRAEYRREA